MRKAIFVGNSFIYYGGCVYTGKTWRIDETQRIDYERRQDDRAYFYQICKQYGVNMSVTDATHGGRILAEFTEAGDGQDIPQQASTFSVDTIFRPIRMYLSPRRDETTRILSTILKRL